MNPPEWADADRMLGACVRGAVTAALRLGHADVRNTLNDYVHLSEPVNGNDVPHLAKAILLGRTDAMRRDFPEVMAAWQRAGAGHLASRQAQPKGAA